MKDSPPNSPLIEPWMSPHEINFRQQFSLFIGFINRQHLLEQPITDYHIFDSGNTSVAALLNPTTSPVVFKTASVPENIINESVVLKHWSQVVSTPNVYFTHPPDTHFPFAFFTSEYISDPILDTIPTQERIDKGISLLFGENLAKIHLLPGIPLDNPRVLNLNKITTETDSKLSKLANRKIIDHLTIQKVEKSLDIISQSPFTPTICHMDWTPPNAFYGDHLTIFDPTVAITDPNYDLAQTLLITEISYPNFGLLEAKEILKGYQTVNPIDIRLLNAYKIVSGLKKISRYFLKNNPEKVSLAISRIQEIEV